MRSIRLFLALLALSLIAACTPESPDPAVAFGPAPPGVTSDAAADGAVADIAAPDARDVADSAEEDTADTVDAADPGDAPAPDVAPDAGCSTDADCEDVIADLAPCDRAACDLSTGECFTAKADNGAACDDGNACTTGDQCKTGVCTGDPLLCDDANPCTIDGCSPEGGCEVTYHSEPCDDGNPCTKVDLCSQGACVGSENECACTSDAQCAALDDGDPCTGVLVCSNALCEVAPGSVPDCAGEAGACQTGACDPATGACAFEPANEGQPCDDGDSCTSDEACSGGTCVAGVVVPCDDGEQCTIDVCTKDGCAHEPASGGCSDGDPCTIGDMCEQGTCVPGDPPSCDDIDPCTVDSCVGGACVHDAVPDGVSCDDGDACTGSATCLSGACQAAGPISCDDGSDCTEDSCDPATGCTHTPKGGPCDDGDACTTGDACVGGECVPAVVLDCDDGDACTADGCAVDGDDGCTHTPLSGEACDDGDACTGGDICVAGACQAGAFDVCGPCAAQPSFSACDDGDAATVADVCMSGACIGFTRTTWLANGGVQTAAAALVDVTAMQGAVVAVGWRASTFGDTTSFAATLQPGETPALMAGSERTDTVVQAARASLAVGTSGKVSLLNNGVWEKSPSLVLAMQTVPGLGDLQAVWGTQLQAATGTSLVWFVGGLNKNNTSPWLARCARDPNPSGAGFQWYCDNQSAIPTATSEVAALWAAPKPCGATCTPSSIDLAVALTNELPGDAASAILESEGGVADQWSVAKTSALPGTRWEAVDGSDASTVWAVGTSGLWARRGDAGWTAPAQLQSESGSIDLRSVRVAGGRVFVVGDRHTTDGSLERTELVLLTAASDAASLDDADLVVLATHECTGAACLVGEDVQQNNALTGVWVADHVLYVVGYEWQSTSQRAVVFTAPLP